MLRRKLFNPVGQAGSDLARSGAWRMGGKARGLQPSPQGEFQAFLPQGARIIPHRILIIGSFYLYSLSYLVSIGYLAAHTSLLRK